MSGQPEPFTTALNQQAQRADAECIWCGEVVTWAASAGEAPEAGAWRINGDTRCKDIPGSSAGVGQHLTLEDIEARFMDDAQTTESEGK